MLLMLPLRRWLFWPRSSINGPRYRCQTTSVKVVNYNLTLWNCLFALNNRVIIQITLSHAELFLNLSGVELHLKYLIHLWKCHTWNERIYIIPSFHPFSLNIIFHKNKIIFQTPCLEISLSSERASENLREIWLNTRYFYYLFNTFLKGKKIHSPDR